MITISSVRLRLATVAGALLASFAFQNVSVAQTAALSETRQVSTATPAAVEMEQGSSTSDRADRAALELPDAPGTMRVAAAGANFDLSAASRSAGAAFFDDTQKPKPAVAPSVHDKYISPGQIAPKLTAGNKAFLGVKDAISPFSAVGWILSAGYEQASNGSPNYGTNSTAFAQRFGASVARDVSEGILSDSVMSPLFHEDPRYYVMGPSHNFFARAIYAATRPVMTRTDGGRQTINLGFLAGNLEGSALTNLYYPQVNRNAADTLRTFGGSLGGGALGFLASEFYDSVVSFLHTGHDTER